MILTSHQPQYLAWLGYFAKIASAEAFCILDTVPYSRHDYTNRVQIKTQRGPEWLTVPVEHGDRLVDTVIVGQSWRRKHLRAIELAYQKAPHFRRYFTDIRDILSERWDFLSNLNECLLRYLLSVLRIRTKIVRASDYQFKGQKSELVLDMCRQLGATRYIFGHMGRDYADVAAFEDAGIEVEFQEFAHPTYPQLHGDFVAGLSCLDYLMNVGPSGFRKDCGLSRFSIAA